MYKLYGPNGFYESETKGSLGGNSRDMIYGTLECKAANNALGKGYEAIRVFFASEEDAIAAGYRPCYQCMRSRYMEWKAGPQPGKEYPWRILPE